MSIGTLAEATTFVTAVGLVVLIDAMTMSPDNGGIGSGRTCLICWFAG